MRIGRLEPRHLVPIVGDGAIAHPDIGDGRLIPVLVVDCKKHSALHDLIQIHSETPPGDVIVRWGRPILDKKHVYLTLDFSRPVPTSASLFFDVEKQGVLVDWIINARGVYLQPLTSGTKVINGIDQPKILVEIPPKTRLPGWEEIYQGSVIQSYRKHGYSRAQAKEAAAQHLARLRELAETRLPPPQNETVDG
jgi:hypothetical protein